MHPIACFRVLTGMRFVLPCRPHMRFPVSSAGFLGFAVVGMFMGLVAASAQTTYRTENAFPGMSFNQPLGIASAPGETDRVFIVEKTGRIQMVTGLSSTPLKREFLDLSARVLTASEQGLLGLAFHPNFATNRYFYVFYCTTATTSAGTGAHNRLSRFTALAAPSTNAETLATEMPMISQFDQAT